MELFFGSHISLETGVSFWLSVFEFLFTFTSKLPKSKAKQSLSTMALKIKNFKAFEIYKQINGPARRKTSHGSKEVDLELSEEILQECGVHLVPLQNVRNSSLS